MLNSCYSNEATHNQYKLVKVKLFLQSIALSLCKMAPLYVKQIGKGTAFDFIFNVFV